MSGLGTGPRRPRWALTVVCALGSWSVAAVLAVMASLSGSKFAAGPAPDPTSSVVFWVLAGVFVAIPIAALPALGFDVRRGWAWALASAAVAVVALLGILVVNSP